MRRVDVQEHKRGTKEEGGRRGETQNFRTKEVLPERITDPVHDFPSSFISAGVKMSMEGPTGLKFYKRIPIAS